MATEVVPATTGVDAPPECSRCEERLDTEGSPRWCKKCRAKYQREYQGLKKEMAESRGYAAGQSAMRECLALHFARFGGAAFNCVEIAYMIRRAPGPDEVR